MKSSKEKFDVVIIGAGPAGLAAGKILAQAGKSVVIIEKNKVVGPKVCAGGLTTKDFKLGIDKGLADRLFSKVILKTPMFEDEIKSDDAFIATVSREKLGKSMLDDFKKVGGKIVINEKIVEISKNFILAENGKKYIFDFLIGADGSASVVRDFLKLKIDRVATAFHYKIPKILESMELHFDADLFGSGYAWVFPHKDFTSIGCGVDTKFLVDSDALQKNFDKWFVKTFPDLKLDKKNYEAWIINYDYKGYEFGNVFLTGDAGGFASGLTGEGMYFAMISGQEVARKILDNNYQAPKLKEILDTKSSHERVLALMDKNKTISQAEYNLLGLVQKSRLLDNILIEEFC